MRLLTLDSQGQPSLTKDLFREEHIPKYAILSHTWSEDNDDEVTLEDLRKDGFGKNKPGFVKIHFCAEQARADGLEYFWIDTCCIDRTNGAELAEAIISMFTWYQKATKCYVYLSDVSINNGRTSEGGYNWEPSFGNSRWFTRGWTLQELVAPSDVVFFSSEGKKLGTKESHEEQICQITGIPVDALQGKRPLAGFTIAERLSWTARRQTSREEDIAYCLFGIVGISMAPLYGEGRQRAWDRLQREIRISSSPELLAASDAPWIVPFERNPKFTGRDEQLSELEQKLSAAKDHTHKIAITGLGGTGKTQLVLELLVRTRARYRNRPIIWISAATTASLNQGYYAAAQKLDLPITQDEKTDVRKVLQDYLSREDINNWILVFDNADDIDMWLAKPNPDQEGTELGQMSVAPRRLIDYLPRSKGGCIIFTTRDRKAAVKLAQQNIVEVSGMDEGTAKDMLRKCLANPDLVDSYPQDASALLAELAHLPLAIVQAAAYMNEKTITLADYLQLLHEEEEEVIDLLSEDFEHDGESKDMKNPVATTWLISFQQIRRHDPLAADYLSFMACILPKDIPQSLLPPAPSRKKEMDAIGMLLAYSFITRRAAELVLDLHRLVHLATRNWLREEKILGQWTERAIVRLHEVFPTSDHKNRATWRMYLPHACQVLAPDLGDKEGAKRLVLMQRCGNCLSRDGRWNEAEKFQIQVLEACKRVLGPERPATLTSMDNLASTYCHQGQWNKAEKLQIEVLEIRNRVLGPEHPNTLISKNNLARIYCSQGEWAKAEELQVPALETMKRVLGPEHQDTLISINNLASTYRNQGQWTKAEQRQEQVVETMKRVLGREHPSTLVSMNNLASIYRKQGRWSEAQKLDETVLEARKKELGLEHPDTLISMNNLAYAQQHQSKDDEVQVLETRKRVLGPENPSTLISMNNLASKHWNQGQWNEAEKLQIRVLETSQRVLGPEHPSTLTSMSNLALTYKSQGHDGKAIEWMTRCGKLRTKVLGPSHELTKAVASTLEKWQTDTSVATTEGDQSGNIKGMPVPGEWVD